MLAEQASGPEFNSQEVMLNNQVQWCVLLNLALRGTETGESLAHGPLSLAEAVNSI